MTPLVITVAAFAALVAVVACAWVSELAERVSLLEALRDNPKQTEPFPLTPAKARPFRRTWGDPPDLPAVHPLPPIPTEQAYKAPTRVWRKDG